MMILGAYKTVLLAAPSVVARAGSRIYISRVPQSAQRPNILLRLGGAGEDFTHQGPTGLRDAEIIVHSRGRTDEEAIVLGDAVRSVLQGWTGTAWNHWINLTEANDETDDYGDQQEVFVHVASYTSYFRRV